MEQMWLMITEKAGTMVMGYCILTMILLVFTLHRIRKNEKQTKRLAEIAEGTLAQVKLLTETNREEQEDRTMEVPPAAETLQPEELLNAVLGEVFPEAVAR